MNYCQNKIKKVLVIGLGGVGTVYANIISKSSAVDLRVLVDNERYIRYRNTPRKLNGKVCEFDYICQDDEFSPDLVIFAMKSCGLKDGIELARKFITDGTVVFSFINGISSEEVLRAEFGGAKVLESYIICHSITRYGSDVSHDGVSKVVWGDVDSRLDVVDRVKTFFNEVGIDNEYSDKIQEMMWGKFCFNCCVNQISAVRGYTFKEIWDSEECLDELRQVTLEIKQLAKSCGVGDIDFDSVVMNSLYSMIPEGKTSMLQDFESGREPEMDLFGAEVIRLANMYKVDVPYNSRLYELVKKLYKEKCPSGLR